MDMPDYADTVNRKSTGGEQALPHNIEAEQALIGALLLSNDLWDRLPDVEADHFYDPVHQKIFEALGEVIGAGGRADPITLRGRFEKFPPIGPDMTVPQYLGALAINATTSSSVVAYAELVIDLAAKRRLIEVGLGMVQAAQEDAASDAQSLVAEAESALLAVSESRGRDTIVTFKAAINAVLEDANDAYLQGGRQKGMSTGLIDLDRKLGGLVPGNLVVIAGRPSMGKAQPLDAPVLLENGEWKRIGDVRLGDRLASIDGLPSLVSGIFPQGSKEVYRVVFSDARIAECCGDHLWEVHCRKWREPKILDTRTIIGLLNKPNMKARLWIDRVSGDFGSPSSLPVDPWLLGALIGNGNLTGNSVRFSTASEQTAGELRRAVGDGLVVRQTSTYDYCLSQSAGKWRHGIQGVVSSPLTEALRSLGLMGLKSEEKFIPPEYMSASRSQRVALIQGLLDTDGWVEKHGTIRFCSSSPRLADDFATLIRSIGGICTVSMKLPNFTHKGEKREGLPAFVCNVMHTTPGELFTNPAKLARARSFDRVARLTISKIEPIGCRDAVCIAVTHPRRLYVTNGYIVTHNTALAMNIAWHQASLYRRTGGKEGCPVQFESGEMQADELATRIIAAETGVNANKIKTGIMSGQEIAEVVRTGLAIQETPLSIDEGGGLTLARIASRARRLKRQNGFGLLVIDYIQLIGGSAKNNGNRVQEVTEVTVGLKSLAKELKIPIIALSQLSRKVEERQDKRPQLSDLRESGSIEQDADVVMFVFREEYYVERSKPQENDYQAFQDWQTKLSAVAGKAEIILDKVRGGTVGICNVAWSGERTQFSNLAISERAMS